MQKISAVIIAFNEEQYIGQCIESLEGVADEIIVVDSYSSDSTEEICNRYNVRFIKHPFEGYVEQKNFALSLAVYPVVLSLDADEALSPELKASILGVKENPAYDGYIFNRLNNYCGKWIRHSGWYPDRHLRLFNSAKGTWEGPNPHDRFILKPGSKITRLKGDLYHWNYSSFEDHLEKINRFSTISANEHFKAGLKAGPCTAVIHMLWGFFRNYILNAGFFDGYLGLVACSISAFASFMKYSKLRKLNLEARRSGNNVHEL